MRKNNKYFPCKKHTKDLSILPPSIYKNESNLQGFSMFQRIFNSSIILLSIAITQIGYCQGIFFKNSLEVTNEEQNFQVFYAVNSGQWNDLDSINMSDSNSLSDVIHYESGDRVRLKVMTPGKRFITEKFLIPHFKPDEIRMVEITGVTLPEEVHVKSDSVFGRVTFRRPFQTDSGRQYRVATCGGIAVIIACAVGNYGELVMQFAGISTIPTFAGSAYIDETFFDQLEKGKQIELKENKGQYFSGLFYHEIKMWDRDKGEIFDLKAGGLGIGFGEAVSIKFTRW